MLTRAVLCVALVAAAAPLRWDALSATGAFPVAEVDRAFAEDAARGGRAELRLSRLAELKAGAAAVRALARHIGSDHATAHEELRAILRDKQLAFDDEPTAEQQATWLHLDQLDGAAFDQAYVAVMLEAHTQDIETFERYGLEGSDADLKAFAERTLATLRLHLAAAGETRVCAHPGS